jgi:tetratricopeptide (TPR) repeat protein
MSPTSSAATHTASPDAAGTLEALERALTSEGRFEDLYEAILSEASLQPAATEGALLAVRAAEVAREGLGEDTGRIAAAIDLALALDPACVPAWQLRLEVASADGRLVEAAACMERMAWLAADPRKRAAHLLQAGDAFRLAATKTSDATVPVEVRAREAYRAAVRAIPPWTAAGTAARRLFGDGGRVEVLVGLLGAEAMNDAGEAGPDAGSVLARSENHLLLGRILVADPGRREEAVAHLVAAVTLADGPGRVALEILGGLHGLTEGWSDLAARLESEAEKIGASAPDRAAALLRRVVRACLDEPVALDRAETALRRLAALDPEDVGSVERLVQLLGGQGRHREAIELLGDLAEIASPATAALHLMRAGVLELARFGEKGASQACFEAALRRHPGCRAAATHLKEAYREAGRWADLARVMVAEVADRPVDDAVLQVYRDAGRLLRDQAGDVIAAAEIYKRIVAHDATDEDAVRFFEDFHERIAREAPAVESHAQEAAGAATDPERVEALVRGAEAARRLGSIARARALLEEARAVMPDDAGLRERLLVLLTDHGDHRAAAELLEADCARLGPGHPDTPRLAGRLSKILLGPLGEVAAARRHLEVLAAGAGEEADSARAHLEALDRDLAMAQAPAAGGEATVAVTDSLAAAREALSGGEPEVALDHLRAVVASQPVTTDAGAEARELAADILIDHLGDLDEGLDRLAELGRERALPVRTRRRVNEARLRLLERDLAPSLQRDSALAEALLDAAAVAEDTEQARAYRYRAGRALVAHADTWTRGAEILEGLLLDGSGTVPILETLAETYAREGRDGPLVQVLWPLAESLPDARAIDQYVRLADVAAARLGDAQEGVRALRRALERAPGDPALLESLTRLAREAEDPDAEVVALRARIAGETDHRALPALQYALGEALEAADRPGEAVPVFRRVLEAEPESLAAWEGLERTARGAGDAETLVEALEGRAAHGRNRLEVASLLAQAGWLRLDTLSDRDGARRLAEQALDLEPAEEDALSLLRRIAVQTGAGPERLAALLRREAEAATEPERRAERWCEAAALYLDQLEQEETAELYYRKALEAHGDHPPALSGLARLHLDAGRPEAAAPYVQALATHEAAPPEARAWAHVRLAEDALDGGDAGRALACLAEAVAADPDAADAHLLRGKIAFGAGRFDEAVEAYAAAVALGEAKVAGAPSGAELTAACAALGLAWRARGRPREAAHAFRKALARDALHEGALHALAQIAETSGEWETVAEMRERAAERIADPKARAAALAEVAVIVRDRIGDARHALAVLRRAATLDPDALPVHASTCALARRLGRPAEAKDAALACARLAPDGRVAADYLAVAADCAEADGDREGALHLARTALERDPACAGALSRAVETLEAAGRREEASEILERAAAHAQGAEARRGFIVARARILEDAGDAAAAAACLARAVAESPGDGGLLLALAGAAPLPPDLARSALAPIRVGLRHDPLDTPRLLAAAALSESLGDLDGAYLCGALLSLIRADDARSNARTAQLRDALAERPIGALSDSLGSELLPEALVAGEAFYRSAEATLLTLPADRRLLDFDAPDSQAPDPAWAEEMRAFARALRLPHDLELRVAPAGLGVRPQPDRGRLLVAEDLLAGRLAGERAFALVFGLSLAVPGRRWAGASGRPEEAFTRLLSWARGEAGADEALDLGERFGTGKHSHLASLAGPSVPDASTFVDAVVVAASRLGLLASGDLVQGLSGGLRLLAPGTDLPRDAGALAEIGRAHPALGDLLGFVHDATFRAARRSIGMVVPGRPAGGAD